MGAPTRTQCAARALTLTLPLLGSTYWRTRLLTCVPRGNQRRRPDSPRAGNGSSRTPTLTRTATAASLTPPSSAQAARTSTHSSGTTLSSHTKRWTVPPSCPICTANSPTQRRVTCPRRARATWPHLYQLGICVGSDVLLMCPLGFLNFPKVVACGGVGSIGSGYTSRKVQ